MYVSFRKRFENKLSTDDFVVKITENRTIINERSNAVYTE